MTVPLPAHNQARGDVWLRDVDAAATLGVPASLVRGWALADPPQLASTEGQDGRRVPLGPTRALAGRWKLQRLADDAPSNGSTPGAARVDGELTAALAALERLARERADALTEAAAAQAQAASAKEERARARRGETAAHRRGEQTQAQAASALALAEQLHARLDRAHDELARLRASDAEARGRVRELTDELAWARRPWWKKLTGAAP